jgi:hypothetical protein
MRGNRRSAVVAAIMGVTALFVGTQQLAAEGALAIGVTGDVAADGVAVGGAYDSPTRDAAIATALANCRKQPNIPKAVAQCKLVGTFTKQCYAAAFDPKSGTPGAGWAIGADAATAKKQALANCQATAGKARTKFCKIDASITACDKHN